MTSMQKLSGPINTHAFISYARAHKPFEQAYNLATKLYAKRKREHTGIKYISHPSTVASLLLEYELHPDTMVAAVLEETLALTTLKASTLETLFGAQVLDLVKALTPPMHEGAGLRLAHGESLRAAGYQAQTVKIVSLLDHVVSIPANKLAASAQRLDDFVALLPYLEGGNQQLLARFKAALRRAAA